MEGSEVNVPCPINCDRRRHSPRRPANEANEGLVLTAHVHAWGLRPLVPRGAPLHVPIRVEQHVELRVDWIPWQLPLHMVGRQRVVTTQGEDSQAGDLLSQRLVQPRPTTEQQPQGFILASDGGEDQGIPLVFHVVDEVRPREQLLQPFLQARASENGGSNGPKPLCLHCNRESSKNVVVLAFCQPPSGQSSSVK